MEEVGGGFVKGSKAKYNKSERRKEEKTPNTLMLPNFFLFFIFLLSLSYEVYCIEHFAGRPHGPLFVSFSLISGGWVVGAPLTTFSDADVPLVVGFTGSCSFDVVAVVAVVDSPAAAALPSSHAKLTLETAS